MRHAGANGDSQESRTVLCVMSYDIAKTCFFRSTWLATRSGRDSLSIYIAGSKLQRGHSLSGADEHPCRNLGVCRRDTEHLGVASVVERLSSATHSAARSPGACGVPAMRGRFRAAWLAAGVPLPSGTASPAEDTSYVGGKPQQGTGA